MYYSFLLTSNILFEIFKLLLQRPKVIPKGARRRAWEKGLDEGGGEASRGDGNVEETRERRVLAKRYARSLTEAVAISHSQCRIIVVILLIEQSDDFDPSGRAIAYGIYIPPRDIKCAYTEDR